MDFEFYIGQEEKHSVNFTFSKIWHTYHVDVDGKLVKKRLTPLYMTLVMITSAVALRLSFSYNFSSYRFSITDILVFLVVPLVITLAVDRLPVTVTIGKKEKHEVKIQRVKSWPLEYSMTRAKFNVFVDGHLFRTFKG